ncbi:TetR/AcrR family transcriptional regulator [Rhodococcus sp. NPDC056960]|uniref:TetR/AcrR family transcriptional regulator n=1 Tax=Rhodococcus sp. NPDC056960 TaxID=3345982 RepID=UPI003636E77E
MPRGRKPADPDSSRRDDVLRAAVDLFSSNPYEDISVDDLCKRAGVSHGLLSYYFGGKRGLFAAAVRQAWEEMVAWEKPRPEETTPAERVHGYVRRHFEYVVRYPERFEALMRTGHADKEVNALAMAAREHALVEIKASLGCPEHPSPRLRAAIWGWVGYMDHLALDWLQNRDLDINYITDLCVQALVFSVREANDVRFDDSELERLNLVIGPASDVPSAGSPESTTLAG